jgi:hypothetical protein
LAAQSPALRVKAKAVGLSVKSGNEGVSIFDIPNFLKGKHEHKDPVTIKTTLNFTKRVCAGVDACDAVLREDHTKPGLALVQLAHEVADWADAHWFAPILALN